MISERLQEALMLLHKVSDSRIVTVRLLTALLQSKVIHELLPLPPPAGHAPSRGMPILTWAGLFLRSLPQDLCLLGAERLQTPQLLC